jgi:uncharacterized protein (TIRG00374 family)
MKELSAMHSSKPREEGIRGSNWRKQLGRMALRLIGVGLFIWVLTRVDLPATMATLRQANPWLVAGGILLAVPIVTIRAWRLRLILQSLGVPLNLRQALLIRLVGTAGGDLLPGRAGEVISVAYLQQAGYGLRDPALTLILDRLFDFVILAVWAVAGLSLIGRQVTRQLGSLTSIVLLLALGFALIIAGLLALRAHPERVKRLARRLIPSRWHAGVDSLLEERSERNFHWNARVVAGVGAASLLAYAFLILRGYLLVRAIGLDLSLPFVAACMAITTLLQLVPVNNVLGVGTREVSLLYLFGLVGVPAEAAVGFSFLIVLALLAQDSIGLFLWWRYPVGTAALAPQKGTN